jgi:hypothetical protein
VIALHGQGTSRLIIDDLLETSPMPWERSRSPAPTSGLPLPRFPDKAGPSSTYYAISGIDRSGRLADRSALLDLDWLPGTPVAISVAGDVVVAEVRSTGPYRVAARGHLRLPAAVRHAAHIRAGDRVLLAADNDHGLLVIYSLTVLDAIVSDYRRAGPAGAAR